MHLMRESWTDARLDDLNEKVDRGFAKIDKRLDRIDEKFERINDRFDRLYHLLLQGLVAIVVSMVGGFATLLAAIIWA